MRKHIPNMITCCNLLSGAVATYMAFNEQYNIAFVLIILAAVFDFFDGFSARLLGVSSPIGKELDSLADDISFGLAPSLMLFVYLKQNSPLGWWSSIVLLMAAFSALRLAKFNLDTRQSDSFIGLATPANTLFWVSLICTMNSFAAEVNITVAVALVVGSLISCFLLVSEIPFFALKFHNAKWKDNKVRFVFLTGSLVLVITSVVLALTLSAQWLLPIGCAIIIWYLILSLITRK